MKFPLHRRMREKRAEQQWQGARLKINRFVRAMFFPFLGRIKLFFCKMKEGKIKRNRKYKKK